ncbi:hypothetical protein ELI54_08440 [Rhizobium ruizarguesonis]|uniref:hypothetical protein n=1 Tax=Rhizobium ruizarguesonis TaxID=2081791 RepID=UPI00102FBE16|nr:hypothetical protein [Rhizobium ruizarguesonis]TAT88233.1 hypothetical protein ELI54_08440 [Rhizobium ruizarguesonis]
MSLIAARLNFVVPHYQLYLPSLLVDLTEKYVPLPAKRDRLSPAAQLTLFYLLQRRDHSRNPFEGVAASGLAHELGVSPMSVLRSFDELSTRDDVRQEKIGRERKLTFHAPAAKIFESFRSLTRSPVTQTYSVAYPIAQLGVISGEHALARYSSLVEPEGTTRAIYNVEWRKVRSEFIERSTDETTHRVEVWAYNPAPLAAGGIVDRLSLNAQFANDGDERVAMAANEILKEVKWF